MECQCGNEYERIAQHWAFNPSHRPGLTDVQYEICVGLLLGDGCVVNDASEAALVVEMKNEEFINWLDIHLGWLSNGYTKKENRRARLRTLSHPKLTELRGWYWTGEKKFPPELELTDLMFEMWYVSDGTRETRDGRQDRMRISSAQEKDRVESILSSVPYKLDYTWNDSPWGSAVVFSVETSKDLWRWMPYCSTGYDYKFPEGVKK